MTGADAPQGAPVAERDPEPEPASAARSGLSAWMTRPVVAGLVLLVAYLALSLFMSPHGYLGTDTGGKVATLETMAHHGGGLDPDVGYWAARWDPEAKFHALYYTYRIGPRYVNVTSLPMLYAALPLYELGGYRLALLLPMAGAVACAFGARALARRLGARDGWAAFWIVGLASPVTIYALDLWEHSLGLALMAWGAIVLLDAVAKRATWWRGAVAGLAFGAAAAMRTEAFVYGFVATGVVCGWLLIRDRALKGSLVVGATAAVGLAAMFGANELLEVGVLGTTMRASRSSGTLRSGGSDLGVRVREAVTMSGALLDWNGLANDLIIAALIGLLAFVAYRALRRGDQRAAKLAAAVVVVLYLLRIMEGPGFVPGLVATTPFAAAGLVLAWRNVNARLVALMALLALPLVWYTDFTGGVLPQWGGRYILTSGLLLGVIGIVGLERGARWARQFFITLAVVVTVIGLVWMSHRTHEVARAGAWISGRPEPVVVSDVSFWLRESGGYEPAHRWLTTDRSGDVAGAARIVTDAGYDRFGLLTVDGAAPPPASVAGYHQVSHQVQRWLGVDFRYTVYQRDPT
jgi:hypothetical protein